MWDEIYSKPDFVDDLIILTAGATGGTNGGLGTVSGKSTSHSSISSHLPHFPPKASEQKWGPSMAPWFAIYLSSGY